MQHFVGPFSNFDKCRPEVAGDVIYGAALVNIGVDVNAKFDDIQWPNYSTLWGAGPDVRTFVQHQIIFCSRPETASEVISSRFAGHWPISFKIA